MTLSLLKSEHHFSLWTIVFSFEYVNFFSSLGPDYTLAFTAENKNICEKKPPFSVWVVWNLSLWKQTLGTFWQRSLMPEQDKTKLSKQGPEKAKIWDPWSGSCCSCSIQYHFTVRAYLWLTYHSDFRKEVQSSTLLPRFEPFCFISFQFSVDFSPSFHLSKQKWMWTYPSRDQITVLCILQDITHVLYYHHLKLFITSSYYFNFLCGL